ncbi:MAG TPA: integrase core domain-containing protein [Anaeromyxobacteraceae bacterium]|nr:integrase core domain-containing protein [Anaeromyxobacteraceae bacterium]
MKEVLLAIFASVRAGLRSRAALQLEVLALRHQLAVYQRCPTRPRTKVADRLLWAWLSKTWAGWRNTLVFVQPSTVIAWQRRRFRDHWARLSRARPGRPRLAKAVQDLIRTMSTANPTWGSRRIVGELAKLGVPVAKATVEKYMVRPRQPPSPTWRAFLDNHVKDLVSVDFFVVPTVAFKVLFVFIVLAHARRRIVHFNVTENPTAQWTAHQISEAFPWEAAPRYLILDRDWVYGPPFQTRMERMGIEEVLTAPRSPWQNPYSERVIGSIRRECLDKVIVLDARHLRRLLADYFEHYHSWRCHRSLAKDCPARRPVQGPERGDVVEVAEAGGLYCHYERRAA